ncbi:serine O-acetyltransferase EpsC [Corallococcus macrosporus]|uniref:Serine acetyltransferase n=2 Tax=Myxococcaceae TaxID=31 RepID=A0A250JRU3_9BACT|nr:serine O-acetyltransferase EpsC [Corallococcus macrosporus]AEI62108.1 putative serine O-acetyltransferase [Corallococcus macrosporus]ATB46101.1 serine acetyltransferase [Corallococcus macrosporus DSM 14697]
MDDSNARLVTALLEARQRHCFPADVRRAAPEFVGQVLGLLFPHFAERLECTAAAVHRDVTTVEASLHRIRDTLAPLYPGIEPDLPARFMERLPGLYEWLRQDADAIFEADPAARTVDEVILTYPGFTAIAIYRVANALHVLGFPLLPRLLTEYAHQRTGVDIHPGATIGRRFVIDHGTGVVIGETTLIGDNVKLYQGVTLGALVVEKGLTDKKRHPTIEDDVVVYANATILGGETVVGRGSIIAGNAWLTQSIPSQSVVTRRSEVRQRGADGSLDALEFHI